MSVNLIWHQTIVVAVHKVEDGAYKFKHQENAPFYISTSCGAKHEVADYAEARKERN